MAKQEPITARAKQNGFMGDNKQVAIYHITLSTDSKGEYGAASVFVSTKNLTADIIALWSYDTDRSRKGTAAEREAVTEAAIAAERAHQTELAELAAIAEEEANNPVDDSLAGLETWRADGIAARVEEPAPVVISEPSSGTLEDDGAVEIGLRHDSTANFYGFVRVYPNGSHTDLETWPDNKARKLTRDEEFSASLAARRFFEERDQKPATEPELYTVTFDLITLDEKERRSIIVKATSAAEAIREAKAEHERYIPLRTEWWNGGRTLVVFEDNDEIAWKLDNYTTTPNPDLDEAPDFLASLDHGTVNQADGGENGLGAFVVALQNAEGRTLGHGFATIEGGNGPALELVCDDYLMDLRDEGWSSYDHGIAAVIARAVAEHTKPDGQAPNIRQYVAAKEAEAFHLDEPWFPSTDEERAASDGLSLEAWREAVHDERFVIEDGGPGMDQLAAADQSPELRAFTHAQWELAAWGYNGDGTPHRKSAAERAQQIAQLLAGTESGPRTMSRGELVDLLAQAYTAGAKAREEKAQ